MGGALAPALSVHQLNKQTATTTHTATLSDGGKSFRSHAAKRNSFASTSSSPLDTEIDEGDEALLNFPCHLVLPVYHTKEAISPEEIKEATRVWKLITSNKALEFLKLKSAASATTTTSPPSDFPHSLCTEYFTALFYQRLFDIHPGSSGLFANTKMKMRVYFISSISMILDDLVEDPQKFVRSLENLAKIHNRIGVKAVEYGVGCEILMYCIRKCVGEEVYTPAISRAWIKIFSRILDVIVPIVVKFEVNLAKSGGISMAEKRAGTSHCHVISRESQASSTSQKPPAGGQCPYPHHSSAAQSTKINEIRSE